MASFFIPLTGLQADTTALNTIANNLANMNTTAFKSESTNFADLFYQHIGSTGAGNPILMGAGVKVASNSISYTQGSINSTGNATDVALNGSGFFVLGKGSGEYELSRAGNFSVDNSGNLLSQSGSNVMGYPAVNGVVNTTAALVPINIPVGQVQEPRTTSEIGMTANLDASSSTGTQFPAQVTIYDSLGEQHVVSVQYQQTAPNTWTYSASLPAADFTSGVSTPITGTMVFDKSGNLSTVAQGSGSAQTVGTASGDVKSIALSFAGLTDKSTDLSIQWNLLGPTNTPTISQVATTSAVSATTQNGYQSGQYQSFAVDTDGTVLVSYSNGQKQNVGQIALGNVTNTQGLELQGDGSYLSTRASGAISIGVSGAAGLGTLQDSALEGSNVNISREFSNLIIAQRAFEANAKSVTTFDTVTQDTINIIR